MRELTKEQYAEICAKYAPKSKTWPDTFKAFLVGGLICAAAQVIMYLWELAGAGGDAATATSMTLVFIAAAALAAVILALVGLCASIAAVNAAKLRAGRGGDKTADQAV